MSPTYGVTSTGFNSKPATVIKSEIEAQLKTILGDSAGTEPDGSIPAGSIAGQVVSILTDGFSGCWDAMADLYSQADPTQATGQSLDDLCSLTGTVRQAATYSTVTGTCTGTPATVVAAGSVATVSVITVWTPSTAFALAAIITCAGKIYRCTVAGVSATSGAGPSTTSQAITDGSCTWQYLGAGTGSRWANAAAGTIAAVSAWQAAHGYTLGERCYNDTPSKVYQCSQAGTSAGGGGPTGTGTAIADNTAKWDYLGAGTGAIDVVFTAEIAGAMAATARALDGISTPIDGWSNVCNVAAATQGVPAEIDSELRVKREEELHRDAQATAEAIRTAVLAVDDVTHCRVFVNDTMATDGDGVPAKSVEVLALGGDADSTPAGQITPVNVSVAAAVYNSVAAGIYTHGTTSKTLTDSLGNSYTVRFTRPTDKPVYIIVEAIYDPLEFPATNLVVGPPSTGAGVDLMKAAIVLFGASYLPGDDVRSSEIMIKGIGGPTVAGGSPCPGILDVTKCWIGWSNPPTAATTLTTTARELATFDAANIVVRLTSGTP